MTTEIVFDPRRPRGEAHGNAKLTAEAVRRMRAGRSAGATLAALAAEHGVSERTVCSIVRRESWRHVP